MANHGCLRQVLAHAVWEIPNAPPNFWFEVNPRKPELPDGGRLDGEHLRDLSFG
jgi:hypothetical protein